MPVLGFVALSPGYAHPPQAPQTGCICSQATLQSGWCIEHERGYVFGIAIQSQMLFEAMDTHGHEVRGDSLTCGGVVTDVSASDEGGMVECDLWMENQRGEKVVDPASALVRFPLRAES